MHFNVLGGAFVFFLSLRFSDTFFQGTSASPLQQEFVECATPWANSVSLHIHEFVRTALELTFRCVPCSSLDSFSDPGVCSGVQSGLDENEEADEGCARDDDSDDSVGGGSQSSGSCQGEAVLLRCLFLSIVATYHVSLV